MRNKIEYIQQKDLNGLLEQYRQNPKCRILGVDGKNARAFMIWSSTLKQNCLFHGSVRVSLIALKILCVIFLGMTIINMYFM